MKRILMTTMIGAGLLVAQTGFSQVYLHANIAVGPRRVYCPPRVVYAPACSVPAPYYDGYANTRVIVERAYENDPRYYRRERFEKRERVDPCFRDRRRDRW